MKVYQVQLSSMKKNRPSIYKHVPARVDSGLKHLHSKPSSPLRNKRPLPPRPHSSPPIVSDASSSPPSSFPDNKQEDQVIFYLNT